ncbi:DUF5659 domain-containing protein [Bacillus cereus]|uniref:DUF5659 domain-containing protein n=1 Tax=Bacillus cereus TaxID=1396 RepID=UPI00159BECEB|nr:DUF5659 domain-containing protein [Bacillus cereus]
MEPITIHTYGMANHLLKNNVPMKEMQRNKFKRNEMVYYFEATPQVKRLMKEYSMKK